MMQCALAKRLLLLLTDANVAKLHFWKAARCDFQFTVVFFAAVRLALLFFLLLFYSVPFGAAK